MPTTQHAVSRVLPETPVYSEIVRRLLEIANGVNERNAVRTINHLMQRKDQMSLYGEVVITASNLVIENLRPIWSKQQHGDELREQVYDLMDFIAQWRRNPTARFRYVPRGDDHINP